MEILVSENQINERLDRFCASLKPEYSREYLKTLIKDGSILVNGSKKKSSYRLNDKDRIKLKIPQAKPLEVVAEKIKLAIIYEDEDLLIVNKAKGMVVHPGCGNDSGTLVNALKGYTNTLSSNNGPLRPGIVHRIDKDTSGLLMVAKNNQAHENLAAQLKEHSVTRLYYAIVSGVIKTDSGVLAMPIGRHPINRKKMTVIETNSKTAITHFKVIKRYENYSFVQFSLETGRTHQIRVHMEKIGHPILGDPIYGHKKQKFKLCGLCLHAQSLGFNHPRTQKRLLFTSQLPTEMIKVLKNLNNSISKHLS